MFIPQEIKETREYFGQAVIATERINMDSKLTQFFICCACVIASGGFGGFFGGWYRRKENIHPYPTSKKEYALFTAMGIICAIGIMFFCVTVSKLFNQQDITDTCSFAIGVSVISGFFSLRLLPKLGSKLEQEMHLLQKKVEEAEQQTKSAITYNQLISMAEMALSEKKSNELKAAIEAMEDVLGMYPTDRMFNIYYGRLLRWSGNICKAINALRQYISSLKKKEHTESLSPIDKMGMAIAFYNISCYHSLLTNDMKGERERLVTEAAEALTTAIKYDPTFKEECKTDEDFKPILKNKPDFFKSIIDTCP